MGETGRFSTLRSLPVHIRGGGNSHPTDAARYPGAHGYGPADIAVAMGVMLKSSAKLASFEVTLVGAPNGYIE